MDTDIVKKEDVFDDARTLYPEKVLQEATKAAKALTNVINAKPQKDKVIIRGEVYLSYEDWLTVGQFYGFSVRTHSAEPVEINDVKGAKARADIITRDGIVVGGAEAYCLSDEDNWKNKPWFQLASMAQTRAGAKALRNRLAWVVVLAGFRPTPAEEMKGVEGADYPDCPECKTSKSVIKGKEEYGGGWVCFKKKGGCGAKWEDAVEAEVVNTKTGEVRDYIREMKEAPNVAVLDLIFDDFLETDPKGPHKVAMQRIRDTRASELQST